MIIIDRYAGDLLYWAVIEHYRSWLIDDGVLLARLQQSGGRLDAAGVRRIAKIYKVNRCIPKGCGGIDQAASWLANRLNEEATTWPVSLNDRASRCALIARDAKTERGSNEIASTVTKLMWFLRPDGWTVFDKLASQGLGIKESGAVARMTAFYKRLSECEFGKHVGIINQLLKGTPFRRLFGERVIDKFLVLQGSKDGNRSEIIETCIAFRGLLPKAIDDELDDVARQIAKIAEPAKTAGE